MSALGFKANGDPLIRMFCDLCTMDSSDSLPSAAPAELLADSMAGDPFSHLLSFFFLKGNNMFK